MNWRLFGFLLVLLVVLVAGCRQQNPTPTSESKLGIDLAVNPDPAQVGKSMLIITVTDAAGQPVNDAAVNVRGDMSHAGMAPVLAEVKGGADGQYSLPFEWTMGGDWFVTVTVTLPDGTTASQRFDLSVASAGGMGMNMSAATPEATP
ncbi:MAG TPA: FixH family protein [Phototrophicaceae bacterium]|nr:FixH family protein [Phototrophicaceae bacterium]